MPDTSTKPKTRGKRIGANLSLALLTIALVSGGLYATGGIFSDGDRTQLVEEIESYCENRSSCDGSNITFAVQGHIKPGMTVSEAITYFEAMDFSVHQSWEDKNLYVADHRSSLGLKQFNVIKTYRFVLRFSDGKLKTFEGSVEIESP